MRPMICVCRYEQFLFQLPPHMWVFVLCVGTWSLKNVTIVYLFHHTGLGGNFSSGKNVNQPTT